MTNIVNNNPYSDKYPYYMQSGKTVESTQNRDGSHSKNDKASVSNKDRVTLSISAAKARTRETMGLSPTGRLKKRDIVDAAQSQQKSVETAVSTHLRSLGFDSDLNISLVLDEENNIVIKEDFSGKADVEKSLNNDSEFLNSFRRLSANNEILNYTANFQTNQITLADYLNARNQDENMFMSLALRYEELKGSANPLQTLLGFSRQDNPYTYVHNPESEIVET